MSIVKQNMNLHWIAVDWGTTNLRVWAMDKKGRIIEKKSSKKGLIFIEKRNFEKTLTKLINPWIKNKKHIPIISCGMVGSKHGWKDVGYNKVPCTPINKKSIQKILIKNKHFSFYIIKGLCQYAPYDVMRGEETQIAGFIYKNPNFNGVICLPGTHCKWVKFSNGKVLNFTTFMTGELFSLITEQSILKYSSYNKKINDKIFSKSFNESMTKSYSFLSSLFQIRAKNLLVKKFNNHSRSIILGFLLGMELASIRKMIGKKNVAIIGSPINTIFYEKALSSLKINTVKVDSEKITLRGLFLVYQNIKH